MRKLITINEKDWERIEEAMESMMQRDLSHLLVALVVYYEQNQKRSPGRPRGLKEEEDPDNDIPRYQAPDYPRNLSVYSYNELVGWYEYDPENRGQIPPRSQLKVHPNYKGQ